ncbi:MAG: hypothetical protein HS119_13295 [Flavobacteriales bacterium]|nr:hypothetical protein [Flavobacteriales bacterium]
MTTITIKINEKSTAGKVFLNFIKTFIVGKKDVEIIELEKNRYNAETENVIADIRKGKGINKAKNSADLFKQLGI